ncbi:MAG: S-layer homology domain-containing protein [Clostridia bacterium]|nr:S-layer homology domain-containing protein [Clostridia bacterium]
MSGKAIVVNNTIYDFENHIKESGVYTFSVTAKSDCAPYCDSETAIVDSGYTYSSEGYDVSGEVKDDKNVLVAGAAVKVMKGNIQIGETAITDEAGIFRVKNIPSGEYNLVVSKGTTRKVVLYIYVADADVATGTIILSTGTKNTVLEISTHAPNIVVKQLNELFDEADLYTSADKNIVNAKGSVELKLRIDEGDKASHSDVVQAAIDPNSMDIGMIMEMSITKLVKTFSNQVVSDEIINDVKTNLVIIIPLEKDMQGKENYRIVRAHDYGSGIVTEFITTKPNNNMEYITVNAAADTLTLYSRYFSTFAVAYDVSVVKPSIKSNRNTSFSNDDTPLVTHDAEKEKLVLLNGQAVIGGDKSLEIEEQDVVRSVIAVDQSSLFREIGKVEDGLLITVPFDDGADEVIGRLNGHEVRVLSERSANIEVKTKEASYLVPAKEIKIESLVEAFGVNVDLSDVVVDIEISKLVDGFEEETIAPKYAFNIDLHYHGSTVSVNNFDQFVERRIQLPDNVDLQQITTGVVIDEDGRMRHVPTKFLAENGRYYAVMNSFENGVYSVIWHDYLFSDTHNHWAEESLGDMGARMVISGVADHKYEPDRPITRAEFMVMVIRAFGLKPQGLSLDYLDVESGDWFSGYIGTARQYNLIASRSDVSFGAQEAITREEATVLVAGYMKLTGLDLKLLPEEVDEILEVYSDKNAISDYAKYDVAVCVKSELIMGRSEMSLAPKAYMTRAEMAVIIKKLLEKSHLIS